MRWIAAFVVVVASCSFAFAASLNEALSYWKPVPGGKYVFVMLGDPAQEAKAAADKQAEFRDLRAKYARTGLYKADTAELMWAVEDQGFAPYDGVFPASDGVHLVRLDGEWWRTYRYPAEKRLPEDVEAKQLAGPAVSFFANGKLVRTYAVNDLITDPSALLHTPEHVLWKADASLNEATGRFIVFTHDSNRVAFDYRTGEIVSRSKAGLRNSIMPWILGVTGALIAVMIGVWVWLVRVKWKRPAVGREAQPSA
jgi:hypothetical protein